MGRQVRFSCTTDDVVDLGHAIARLGLVVLAKRSPNGAAQLLSSLPGRPTSETDSHVGVLLALPGDIDRIRWRYIEAKHCWYADAGASPAIAYTPGFQRDGQPWPRRGLAHGRFWVDTSWWGDGDERVRQSRAVLAVAARLMSWVKRNWVYSNSFWYESARAHDLLEAQAQADQWLDAWYDVLDEPAGADPHGRIAQWRNMYRSKEPLRDDDMRVTITGPYWGAPGRLKIQIRHRPC